MLFLWNSFVYCCNLFLSIWNKNENIVIIVYLIHNEQEPCFYVKQTKREISLWIHLHLIFYSIFLRPFWFDMHIFWNPILYDSGNQRIRNFALGISNFGWVWIFPSLQTRSKIYDHLPVLAVVEYSWISFANKAQLENDHYVSSNLDVIKYALSNGNRLRASCGFWTVAWDNGMFHVLNFFSQIKM